MNTEFAKFERQKNILEKNKMNLENMLQKELEKMEVLKNSDIDKKELRIELLLKTIAIRKNALKKITDNLDFLRPQSELDIKYRINQYDNFSKLIEELMPDELPLRFHGCSIYTARDIIKSGELSSSVDRLGIETSFDVENQVSVTTKKTIATTVQGYTHLIGDYTTPAGCIFVVLPKNKEDEEAGDSMLMGNVNFIEEPDRLVGIITTPENIDNLAKWCTESGIVESKIYNFETFIDKFSKQKNMNDYSQKSQFLKSLEVNVKNNSQNKLKQINRDNGSIRYTDKIALSNGYDIQVVEYVSNESESKVDTTKTTFKINKIGTKPIKSSTVFLTKDDDYVGHASANIFENNTADLAMFNLRYVNLPEELERLKQVILDTKSDVALKVDEKYQGLGKGKELMTILLNYLVTQSVRDVTVSSISNDIAMNTYLKTGAEKTGEKTAIYRNIKELLKKEKNVEIKQSNEKFQR